VIGGQLRAQRRKLGFDARDFSLKRLDQRSSRRCVRSRSFFAARVISVDDWVTGDGAAGTGAAAAWLWRYARQSE